MRGWARAPWWGCWLAVLAHPKPTTATTHRAAGSPAPPPGALARPGDDDGVVALGGLVVAADRTAQRLLLALRVLVGEHLLLGAARAAPLLAADAFAGTTATLTFAAGDVGDSIFDTVILVDNVKLLVE